MIQHIKESDYILTCVVNTICIGTLRREELEKLRIVLLSLANENTIFGPWVLWLSWLECGPMHWKVSGLVPGQGTHTGFSFNPWSFACKGNWYML